MISMEPAVAALVAAALLGEHLSAVQWSPSAASWPPMGSASDEAARPAAADRTAPQAARKVRAGGSGLQAGGAMARRIAWTGVRSAGWLDRLGCRAKSDCDGTLAPSPRVPSKEPIMSPSTTPSTAATAPVDEDCRSSTPRLR